MAGEAVEAGLNLGEIYHYFPGLVIVRMERMSNCGRAGEAQKDGRAG